MNTYLKLSMTLTFILLILYGFLSSVSFDMDQASLLVVLLVISKYLLFCNHLFIFCYYVKYILTNVRFDMSDKVFWSFMLFSFGVFTAWFYRKRYISSGLRPRQAADRIGGED